MTEKKTLTTWISSLAELHDSPPEGQFHHPGLRYATFIFCDDKPTEDNRGIEYEDFESLAQSAVGTPVKMKFLGQGIGNHIGSIPIGYITQMAEHTLGDGSHQLIAQATLFADEFPDEIEYLEERFAEKQAPGISWEISYKSKLVKAGVSWLKDVLARAATFVRNPAYGSRTALLALASNNEISDEEFSQELSAFADELRPKTTDKGGNNNVTEEELKAKLEAAEAKVTELEGRITDLETANATLVTDKEGLASKVSEYETTLAAQAAKELITERTRLITEAGIKIDVDGEKLAKKQSFWASMEADAFAEYVDDLKMAAKPEKKELASFRANASRVELPRLTPEENRDISDLKARFSRR